jgi:hypothetical protein
VLIVCHPHIYPTSSAVDRARAEKNGKELLRDPRSLDLERLSAGGERGGRRAEQRHTAEGNAVRPPLLVVELGDPGLVEAVCGVGVPEHHQPLRVSERQRPEQDGVDDAEDCGVGADAQRERQERDAGEGRLLEEGAESIAHRSVRRERWSTG